MQLRADENIAELEPLLAFFATFVLRSEVVRRIMRWDMAVFRESPWYREILEEGIEQGVERGIRQEREEGRCTFCAIALGKLSRSWWRRLSS